MNLRSVAVTAMAAGLLVTSGCVSLGFFETAQTAPPGQVEFTGSWNPVFISDLEDLSSLPLPRQTLRVGVTPRMDFGLTLVSFSPALGISAKQMFLTEPVAGAAYLGGELFFVGDLRENFGLGFGNLSPRFIFSNEAPGKFPFMASTGFNWLWDLIGGEEGSDFSNSLWAVGTLGLPFRFGDRGQVRLMPALELGVPVAASGGGEVKGVMFSLGVSIGNVRSEPDDPSFFGD